MIMVISIIMIVANHFSKQVTLSLITSKSKNNIGFYYESIDSLEYMMHFVYRFVLAGSALINLSLLANIINSIF